MWLDFLAAHPLGLQVKTSLKLLDRFACCAVCSELKTESFDPSIRLLVIATVRARQTAQDLEGYATWIVLTFEMQLLKGTHADMLG